MKVHLLLIAALCLSVTAIALYYPTLDHGFVHDDTWNVEHNEAIRLQRLDRESLVIPEGRAELTVRESWRDGAWETVTDGDPHAVWNRTTTVRQFNINDLLPGHETPEVLDHPLPGGTPDTYVHLRMATVSVEGRPSGPVGPLSSVDVILLRGF